MPVSHMHANTSHQGCLITNYFIIAFSRQKALPACEFYINWYQMSIMSIGHTQMSNGPLDEKKCPLDIEMSICLLRNRNVHWTFKCPFVHWTNRNVQWTFKCPFVHWTNRNVQWTFKCPFVYWRNRNIYWTFKCPFVHWTNGNVVYIFVFA